MEFAICIETRLNAAWKWYRRHDSSYLKTPELITLRVTNTLATVYPKKYAHGFWFAVLCCGYTLTDFPISTRLTSLALWQSNHCPSASKATLMNLDKYFMWIHYERLHNHNKAKHNKTVCIFLGIYCIGVPMYCRMCLQHPSQMLRIYQIFQPMRKTYAHRLGHHKYHAFI